MRRRTILMLVGIATLAGAGTAERTLRSSLHTAGGLSAQQPTMLHSAVHEPATGTSQGAAYSLSSGFLAVAPPPPAPIAGDAWAIR